MTTGTLIAACVGLGLLLRFVHFLRFPSVWHDEAALLINVVRLNFEQMFGPLLEHEAAPPFFLVLERVIMLLFGDGIVALRSFPFLASCASLVLFAFLARRILPQRAAPWAVAFFAVSDRLLWHSVEAKPYAIDVFIAVAAAFGYVSTRHWQIWKQGLLWLVTLPAAIWVSYPACFVCGGLIVGMLPPLLRSRSARDWSICLALAAAVCVSFVLLATGPAKAQRDGPMESCWTEAFADWQHPWGVPAWIVRSTLGLFSYSIGPNGWMFVGFIAAGCVFLWRTKERNLLAVIIVPMLLNLFAALIGKYPYGDTRANVFLAPAVCLLTAAGIPIAIDWLRKRSSHAEIAVWVLCAVPFFHTAYRSVVPWDRVDSDGASRHVLTNWRPGDAVAFNNWECLYLLRRHPDAFYDLAKPPAQSPQRLWYVAMTPLQAHRDELLKTIPPCWRLAEKLEFKWATVALFLPDDPSADSTSSAASLP